MKSMKSAIALAALTLWSQWVIAQEMKSTTLHIDKIQCVVCAATVKKALNGVTGVKSVDVDVDKKEVVVQYDPAKTAPPELAEATRKRGFPAQVR